MTLQLPQNAVDFPAQNPPEQGCEEKMYTAAVLAPMSAQLLKWITKALIRPEKDRFVFQTEQKQPLPHHMTINLGEFDQNLNDPSCLGSRVELRIDCIYINYCIGVCAAKVHLAQLPSGKELKVENKVPHVTICLVPGTKPMSSNTMLESLGDPASQTFSYPLDQTYFLDATIQEVH